MAIKRADYYTVRSQTVQVDSNPPTSQFFTALRTGETKVGVENKQWRDQVRNHQQAGTPASSDVTLFLDGYVDVEVNWSQWSNVPLTPRMTTNHSARTFGSPWLGSPPSSPTLAPSQALALNRFLDSIQSKYKQANGLQVLVELQKTVHELKHPLSALVKLLESREVRLKRAYKTRIRKKRSISPKDLQDAVADTWLEAQFGLKPLVSDIEDITTYLQYRAFNTGAQYFPVSGKSKLKSSSRSTSSLLIGGLAGQYLDFSNQVNSFQAVRYRGELKIPPVLEGWSWVDFQRLGFSLRNFAPVLWEITPWSFLVDYFADVGGFIDAINTPLMDLRWVIRSRHSESRLDCKPAGFRLFNNAVQTSWASVNAFVPPTCIVSKSDRVPLTYGLLPRPEISLRLPVGKRLANIAALAWSNSRERFSSPLFKRYQ